MKGKLAGLLALALAAQGTLFAQDQAAPPDTAAPPEKAPRRILFVMEKGGLFSGYSDNEMVILKRSFLTALADTQDAPEPIDWGSKPFPGTVSDRNKVARDAGADCWLWIKISGFRGSPSISVLSYDLLYNIKALDFSVSRSEGFSMLDIYRERWDDVMPRVARKYPPIVSHEYSRGPPAPVTLTIHAVPGTHISGLSQQDVLADGTGTATIQLPSPAPYSMRAVAGGYLPSKTDIYLDGPTEMTLDQTRSPWLKLDAAFLDGFFPGVSASFSVPSWPLFARLGFTTFRAGVAVNQNGILTSIPLSQLTFLLGAYLSPEDSETRYYLGAGPLLRVSAPPGGSLVVDGLLPFGVQLVAGAEFPFAWKLRAFVEYAPTGYSTPLPDLFRASFGTNNGTFPYIAFPKWALDLFEARVGLRWTL